LKGSSRRIEPAQEKMDMVETFDLVEEWESR
jgi:hypothetical protein